MTYDLVAQPGLCSALSTPIARAGSAGACVVRSAMQGTANKRKKKVRKEKRESKEKKTRHELDSNLPSGNG